MKSTSRMTKGMFTILLGLTVVVFASETFAQGTWTTEAPMPTARYGAIAKVVNGILYVAGGNNGTVGVASLEGYNPATNTWSSLAPMPSDRWLSEAAVINGQIYVVGGWGGGSCCPNNNLWVYDPPTNMWSSKTSPPTLTAQGAAGVINGKLYVTTAANGFSGWRNFLHVYDPVTNGWTQLPNSPNVHVSPAAGVIDGKFYVVGGHDGIGFSGATDVYDPLTNTWTTADPGAHGFYSSASNVINGLLYAVGGYDGTAAVATVEVYDPASNTWTTQASMPTARSFPAAGVVNGTLYAVGGSPSSGPPLATNEAFTPEAPNQPPIANAGADQTVDATSPAGALVILNGTGSSDPDAGDTLTFSWIGPFGTAVGATPTVLLPVGMHIISLTVTDPSGATSTDTVAVTVRSPAEMTSNLTATITILEFQQAVKLLGNVVSQINAGNLGAGCNQLNAFIDQAQAQSGKQLTVDEANQLIASANQIKAALGCP